MLPTVLEESYFYEILENILHGFFSEIISDNPSKLSSNLFEEKHIILWDFTANTS